MEVIWSLTLSDSGRSASTSTSHGGFDDDPPTMNSIARRVLNKADADPIDLYPAARSARAWADEIDLPLELAAPTPGVSAIPAAPVFSAAPQPWSGPAQGPARPGGGRRLAVCIGVDDYPTPQHRLSGCVNDARAWAGALSGLGFKVSLLLNAAATRSALQQEIARLVGESRPGDVIVLQYSGHGTQVPDLNQDEEDGIDEALCPVDFASARC